MRKLPKCATPHVRRGAIGGALLAAALSVACGPIKTVSRDGYRALLVFGPQEKFSLAVRGEKRRVEGLIGGSMLVKIMRPDLAKIWQFRPATRKLFEEKWEPTDEIVPGYPLEPRFDQHAYADRFHAAVKQIGDGIHGIHPCDRYLLTLPSGDRVTVWAARDLERLPVKVEQEKKTEEGFQLVRTIELLDVRVGASEELFEKPKGYGTVGSPQELGK
jgi:hypothetical protein